MWTEGELRRLGELTKPFELDKDTKLLKIPPPQTDAELAVLTKCYFRMPVVQVSFTADGAPVVEYHYRVHQHYYDYNKFSYDSKHSQVFWATVFGGPQYSCDLHAAHFKGHVLNEAGNGYVREPAQRERLRRWAAYRRNLTEENCQLRRSFVFLAQKHCPDILADIMTVLFINDKSFRTI